MKVPFVNLGAQYKSISADILGVVDQLSSQGQYIGGPPVAEFESSFAEYCDSAYCIGVANGTDALFLILKGLGIGPGDEVITASNSFIATAGAIVACGATPVFADVDDDYNISIKSTISLITSKTRAIIPIHLTGNPADMDPLNELATRHNIAIVEDAAQAIGATYKGRKVGSLGRAAAFSLHPLKNLHLQGDAGAITTDDPELNKKIRMLQNHGLANRDECDFFGYNSRLDSLQAGIGNIKLKLIDDWNERFRMIASQYQRGLSQYVKTPTFRPQDRPVFHNFVIRLKERDALVKYLADHEIDTKVHYPIPIHLQRASKVYGYKEGDLPQCEAQAKEILSLPIYPELTEEQVAHIIKTIQEFVTSKES